MNPEKIVKREAREILGNNNWPQAFGVAAIIGFALMTVIYVSFLLIECASLIMEQFNISILYENALLYYGATAVLTIIGVIFMLPLIVGAVRFMYKLAKEKESDLSQVFHYTNEKRYFPTIKLCFVIFRRCIWQIIICFLPGVTLYITAFAEASGKDNLDFYNVLWYVISYAMIIGGIFLLSYLTADKFLTLYYCFETDSLSAEDALAFSQKNMVRFEKSVHRMMLLHLPWILSCILIIPMFFAIPYIMLSYAVSAKWIIELSDKEE